MKLSRAAVKEWHILHFFFDFRTQQGVPNTFEGLLRSLLLQICELTDVSAQEIPNFTTQKEILDRPVKLRAAFFAMLKKVKSNFCFFVDGLDEYEGDWSQLVDFLVQVASKSQPSNSNI